MEKQHVRGIEFRRNFIDLKSAKDYTEFSRLTDGQRNKKSKKIKSKEVKKQG